jgi:hypothetical protein
MEKAMNLKNTCISACACAAGFMILGGCQASAGVGVGNPSTTSAVVVVDNDHAINALTKARCDREDACNNLGADKKYDSFAACEREIRHDTAITLRPEKCTNGVISERLDSCLDEIRTDRCGNPLDHVERIAACRKAMLCR